MWKYCVLTSFVSKQLSFKICLQKYKFDYHDLKIERVRKIIRTGSYSHFSKNVCS